ncbi:2869_t:CDS:2 [Funneliformis mosseae]|uniref:2869_t:CDS:1 n=1 Tax=Funneliformis mosseae TaxID=27381 RepID=A0A9N8ZGM6_FUNMO|nr:2869_t:CDS:2 [Funneliformis mosseae]
MHLNTSHHRRFHCSLPIVVIAILIFSKFPTFCVAYDTSLTHLEDPARKLYLFDSYTEKDGTLLIQFAHYNNLDQTCIDPEINLRIVFPDGTVKSLEFTDQVPDYNFCMLEKVFMNYFINKHLILITYFNGTDEATTIHTGMVIDLDGNILQFIELGIGIGNVNRNINEETGFMWTRLVNGTAIAWSRFAPMPSNPKQIIKIGSGFFSTPNPSSIIRSYDMFSSSDGGNGLILVTKPLKTSNDPVSDPAWEVYAIFMDKTASEISAPYLIYQSPIDWFNVEFGFCRKTANGQGYNCLMFIETVDAPKQPPLPKAKEVTNVQTTSMRYRLTFLTSGSVTSIKKLDMGKRPPNEKVDTFNVLFDGGFLVTYDLGDNKKNGMFLTQDGEYDGEWEGFNGDIIHYAYIESNDTMWGMFYQVDAASWTIMTNPLQYKHRNPNILETTPTDMTIGSKSLDSISIQYDKPILFSSGNISIYQVIDNLNDLLRQSYSGISGYASISDNTTVNIEVFPSTFNNPSASYFVTIDDNFVSSKKFNEAIMGINKRIWFLNTSMQEPDPCKCKLRDDLYLANQLGRNSYIEFLLLSASASVLLRFNAVGTKYLKYLDSDEVSIFYNELMNEFSEIIPIERSRLSDTGKFQNDPFDSNNFVLMQVRILQPDERTKPCAKDIVGVLDSLVKNKYSTLISRFPLSSMLDEKYGVVLTPEGWSLQMKMGLIFILGGALLVTIVFFIFRHRNPNSASSLYIPSILFLIGPTGFNAILALYIILKEQSTNESFRKWFMTNTKVVSLLTILASADVGVLNIITSKLAGLSYFCAPMSKEAEIKVFWGSFINIFLEDVPQFVIRIIYLQQNSIIYDPIPVIALISAGISILFSLIGRGFDALFYKIPFSERSGTGKKFKNDENFSSVDDNLSKSSNCKKNASSNEVSNNVIRRVVVSDDDSDIKVEIPDEYNNDMKEIEIIDDNNDMKEVKRIDDNDNVTKDDNIKGVEIPDDNDKEVETHDVNNNDIKDDTDIVSK